MLLVSAVCLLGATSILAQEMQVINGQYVIDDQRYATQYATMEEYEKVTGERVKRFSEAPMLRSKVAAGELPPVEQRLPEDLVVIIPTEKIGQYGGTMRTLNTFSTWSADAQYFAGTEHFFRLAPDNKTVIPNIAKGWKCSKDGKSITIYLRKGMKWSDGASFTAEDIMFWYEDVLLNKELTPVIGINFTPGEKPVVVKKIDDYTVSFHFAVPFPIVEYVFARLMSFPYPKHYLKKFHIKYNSKANELAKGKGYDYWYQLFRVKMINRDGVPMIPDFPTLSSFICAKCTPEYFIFERNPYYWKVDSAGNQLPYVDRIRSTYVQDPEMYTTKIATGQSGFAIRTTSLDNYPLYKENAEKGKYRVILWKAADCVTNVFYLVNLTHKDPVLRKIFRDVRFRRALSLAFDREPINEALLFGKGRPTQCTVRPGDEFYEERFLKAYTDYDPQRANQLLDEMGLKWDKRHEYRLRPDGKRLSFVCEIAPGGGAQAGAVPTTEMVAKYWKNVGIDVSIKTESRELLHSRRMANEEDMEVWVQYQSGIMLTLAGTFWVPVDVVMPWPLWARWYRGEEGGEEPPENVKEVIKWWKKMRTTIDEEERIQLGKKIVASQAENLWRIGVAGLAPIPLIVDERLCNVPEKYDFGFDWDYTAPVNPEQFFLK